MMMHILKTKLQKYQGFIDKAFQLIQQGGDEQIFEVGCFKTEREFLGMHDCDESHDQGMGVPEDFAGLSLCPLRLSTGPELFRHAFELVHQSDDLRIG